MLSRGGSGTPDSYRKKRSNFTKIIGRNALTHQTHEVGAGLSGDPIIAVAEVDAPDVGGCSSHRAKTTTSPNHLAMLPALLEKIWH